MNKEDSLQYDVRIEDCNDDYDQYETDIEQANVIDANCSKSDNIRDANPCIDISTDEDTTLTSNCNTSSDLSVKEERL